MKDFTLLLVQHSHTDVGYTHAQPVVRERQAAYLRAAVGLAEADADFRWTCETAWAVEAFLEEGGAAWRDRLAAMVAAGRISLSLSYLNLTQLPGRELLGSVHRKSAALCRSLGSPARAAMTADINGHSLAWAESLADAGARFLFAQVHSHHGFPPLGASQRPFRWKLPSGRELLVWNGEHYQLANSLGLMPGAVHDFQLAAPGPADPAERIRLLLPRYAADLRAAGYPFDAAPLGLSGMLTDNAPPNGAGPALARSLAADPDFPIAVRHLSLDELHAWAESVASSWPLLEGEWPDWWSDGFLADPDSVRLFRSAQRGYEENRKLAVSAGIELDDGALESALIEYAEHTFGHAESCARPADLEIKGLEALKRSRAAQAWGEAKRLEARLEAALGSTGLEPGLPWAFLVRNNGAEAYDGPVCLVLENAELVAAGRPEAFAVRDEEGRALPHGLTRAWGSLGFDILAQVPAGGERRFRIEALPSAAAPLLWIDGRIGSDRIRDIADPAFPASPPPRGSARRPFFQTQAVRIGCAFPEGILSWEDVQDERSLIRSGADYPPFTLVAERSPADSPWARTGMGRNRKLASCKREAARLVVARSAEAEPFGTIVTLEYEIAGCDAIELGLTLHQGRRRVDARLEIRKQRTEEAANLYLSLPFSAGEGSVPWIDAGICLKPWVEQLPGTLADFYTIQDGWGLAGPTGGIVVASPDAPVLQLGPLAHGYRLLMGHSGLDPGEARPFAWLLGNHWETNFPVSLGGVHRWDFSIVWGPEFACAENGRRMAATLCRPPRPFRAGRA